MFSFRLACANSRLVGSLDLLGNVYEACGGDRKDWTLFVVGADKPDDVPEQLGSCHGVLFEFPQSGNDIMCTIIRSAHEILSFFLTFIKFLNKSPGSVTGKQPERWRPCVARVPGRTSSTIFGTTIPSSAYSIASTDIPSVLLRESGFLLRGNKETILFAIDPSYGNLN